MTEQTNLSERSKLTIIGLVCVVLVAGMITCTQIPPTPADSVAVKQCLDKGWIPSHFSNGIKIQFECFPPDFIEKLKKSK